MVKIDDRETKSITIKMVWQPSMVLFEPDAGTDFNLVQRQIELGCQICSHFDADFAGSRHVHQQSC